MILNIFLPRKRSKLFCSVGHKLEKRFNLALHFPFQQMESELERFHKQNTSLELNITELRLKLKATDKEMHMERQRVGKVLNLDCVTCWVELSCWFTHLSVLADYVFFFNFRCVMLKLWWRDLRLTFITASVLYKSPRNSKRMSSPCIKNTSKMNRWG